MKKLNIILLLVFVLTGCSTTRIYQEPSSKCKYEVTGLSCKNEMIYQQKTLLVKKLKRIILCFGLRIKNFVRKW